MTSDNKKLIRGIDFWNTTGVANTAEFYAEWNEWRIKRGLPIVYPPSDSSKVDNLAAQLAHAMGITEEEVRQKLGLGQEGEGDNED